ncbi:MAG: tetratricopeptide repeat protein [Candidatus Hodarchaeales archaeon]
MSKDPRIHSLKTQHTSSNEALDSSKFKDIRNLIYSGQFQAADQQVKMISSQNSLKIKDRIEIKLIETKLFVESREFEKSLELIAEVINLTKSEGNKLQEIDANISLAMIHLAQNSIDDALAIYDKTYKLLQTFLSQENEAYMVRKASLLFIRGNISRRKGELDKAIESLQQSIFIFQNLNLNYEIACSLNCLGIVFGQKGEFDRAHNNLNRSLEIFVTYDNNKQILKTLNNIGMILWQKGDLDAALEYYKRGQILANELDNKNANAALLINMGLIHRDKGNYSFSLDYFQKALEIFSVLKRKNEVASCLNNIGSILMMKGELDRVHRYFDQSLAIKIEVVDKEGIAFCYNNIGYLFEMKGDLAGSIEEYRKGLEIFEQIGNHLNISLSLWNLIRVSVLAGISLDYEQYLGKLKKIHDTDLNKRINQRYRFSKALVLKTSERVTKKGESQRILEQLAQEPISLDLGVQVLLNLCELLLEEIKLTGNDEVIKEVKSYIEKLHGIAGEENSYPWLVQIYWLQSRLAMLELDVEKD